MKNDNPIGTLHAALAHAQYHALSDISYQDRDWDHFHKTKEDRRISKTRRPGPYDMEVFAMFSQTWSSTALGFGGIGGQAISTNYVIIIECNDEYAVYFGDRHAYTITRPNNTFFQDAQSRRMADVRDGHHYKGNKND